MFSECKEGIVKCKVSMFGARTDKTVPTSIPENTLLI